MNCDRSEKLRIYERNKEGKRNVNKRRKEKTEESRDVLEMF
jgi:hypothetical protein